MLDFDKHLRYFNDEPQPIYVWIPKRSPQVVDDARFRGRVDTQYAVRGANKYKRHRALKLINPTTEMSGQYRCKVSSFVDEDFMSKTMVVYCE